MFRCPSCAAVPEPILGANMTIVRHAPGCPLLIAATRTRWPLVAAGLPDTPRPVIFGTHAGRVWPRSTSRLAIDRVHAPFTREPDC